MKEAKLVHNAKKIWRAMLKEFLWELEKLKTQNSRLKD